MQDVMIFYPVSCILYLVSLKGVSYVLFLPVGTYR